MTALTRRLKELRWSHPLGEADLRQVVTHRLQLRGGLAGTLGGLVPHQLLRPVGRRLKPLQLPLPVRAPVPTVAEGAAAGRRAKVGGGHNTRTRGVRDTRKPPPAPTAPRHPLNPLVLTCRPGEVPLCPCSLAPAPRRLLRGVSGGPPPRCPSPPRPRPHRLPGERLSATAGWEGMMTKTWHPRVGGTAPAPPQHPVLGSPGASASFCSLGGFCSSILPPASLGGGPRLGGGEIHQHRAKGTLPQTPPGHTHPPQGTGQPL